MNNEIKEQLELEVSQGDKARKAYDLYLKQFIIDTEDEIVITFKNLSLLNKDDENAILELKRLQMVVSAFEQKVLTDIETGELASAQIAKGDENG